MTFEPAVPLPILPIPQPPPSHLAHPCPTFRCWPLCWSPSSKTQMPSWDWMYGTFIREMPVRGKGEGARGGWRAIRPRSRSDSLPKKQGRTGGRWESCRLSAAQGNSVNPRSPSRRVRHLPEQGPSCPCCASHEETWFQCPHSVDFRAQLGHQSVSVPVVGDLRGTFSVSIASGSCGRLPC